MTVLHRPNSKLAQLQRYPVRLVEGEIEDAHSLDRVMAKDLDAVFHVAGDTSMWAAHRQRQWRTNVDGTRNMVMTALAKGSKNLSIRRRQASTAFHAILSMRRRQNSERATSIISAPKRWRRKKYQRRSSRDWTRSF